MGVWCVRTCPEEQEEGREGDTHARARARARTGDACVGAACAEERARAEWTKAMKRTRLSSRLGRKRKDQGGITVGRSG